MKFLCIESVDLFHEGSTYEGHLVYGGGINLLEPSGTRKGKLTTWGPFVRSCMVEDPEQDIEVKK